MKRFLLAGLLLALAHESAAAHAFLIHADPGAGSVLSRAPREVVLDFSEELEPAFSTVAVTDGAGHSVISAPSAAAGTRMTVPLKPLGQGKYQVTWQALSVDTHKTEGSFFFTIKP